MKYIKDKRTVVLALVLIVAGIFAGYLLYQHYLKPEYELKQLLPADYQISFEFKYDRFTFPKLQQQKILKNQVLAGIYQEISAEFNQRLNEFSAEAANFFDKTDHFIIFYQDAEQYGLIANIPNAKLAEKLSAVNFNGYKKAIVKEQILALATSQELLNNMVSQKLSDKTIPYLSVTIDPWLTIRLNDSFFSTSYPGPLLSGLQQVLKPLNLQTAGEYVVEFDSDSYSLAITLSPKNLDEQAGPDLEPYLDYLLADPEFSLALGDVEEIQGQLASNQNLQALWQKLDSHLWISRQVSLSNIIKNIKPPLFISFAGENWQILTAKDNLELIDYYLRSYFAQLRPKEIEKVLPDGTIATELIADPEQIQLVEDEVNGWQTFKYTDGGPGYALKDDLLLELGNNLGQYNFSKPDLFCSFAAKEEPASPVHSFLTLEADLPWLAADSLIKNFSNIKAIAYENGQIRLCLGL